ncbi:putative manganese-dependent inorganic diphosphatase [Peptoniphilaceae bacterium SGI.137]|nr:putative manganese-dependent inorganic diphosphatase [Peptoniphilaceae bacterium]
MDNLEKIYISGHRVPDTDSICAALSYAELKRRTGNWNPIPIRLGEINRETRFVLDYFGVKEPILMDSMQSKLSELPIDSAYGVAPETTLKKATEIIQENHLNSLAVVDENDQLRGVISLSNITMSYATVWNDNILGRSETPIENIIDVLAASIRHMPKEPRRMSGSINVYAMNHVDNDTIQENDIVIVGDRPAAQEDSIRKGSAIIILTNNSDLADGLDELCEEYSVTVLRTAVSTYTAARLLPQAVPVRFLMTSENIVSFHLSDYVDEVREKMASTRFRSYPVLDSKDRVVGAISRYHLINIEKKKVILVDHNESQQSIPDLNRAEILEIIDHHRVANVMTTAPIYFRVVPVGCTCTIISQMFFEQGLRPSKEAAGLMCSAIISDTLLFRSPTTTEQDRIALSRLAPIAGIDPESYAMEMFRAGTDLTGKDPEELLTQDVKPFEIGGSKVEVAQIMTIDMSFLETMENELLESMKTLLRQRGLDTFVLLLTNIFAEESEVLVVGDYADSLSHQFGVENSSDKNRFLAKGLLSRKKQLVPRLTAAINEVKAVE